MHLLTSSFIVYLFILFVLFSSDLYMHFVKKKDCIDFRQSALDLIFWGSNMIGLYLLTADTAVNRAIRLWWKFNHLGASNLRKYVRMVQFSTPENKILYYLLLFLLVDFAYYLHHRFSHRIPLFWAVHSVHHSPTKLNFLSTHRILFRFSRISVVAFFHLIPLFFGYSPAKILWAYVWVQNYTTILHSSWFPRLPRFIEYVFNTPYHHRIHHSIEGAPRYGNYGGALIIFDRIFGTIKEIEDRPFTYGVPHFEKTLNPIKINFQYYFAFIKTMISIEGTSNKLFYFFGLFRYMKKNSDKF